MRKTVVLVFVTFCHVFVLDARARPEFPVVQAQEPPRIDGALEDAVWQNSPLILGDWISYNAGTRRKVHISYRRSYRL